MSTRLNVVVVGAGYWGPNLARNFRASPDWDLAAVCDLDIERARRVADRVGGVPVTSDLDEVLADPTIDAVAIATPARTHHADRAGRARRGQARHGREAARRHPRARRRDGRARRGARARAHGRSHLLLHAGGAEDPRADRGGSLGDILFVDSVRINLGLIQPDVDVFWDLAPHDLSIIDFVLPGGLAATPSRRTAPIRSARASRASAT